MKIECSNIRIKLFLVVILLLTAGTSVFAQNTFDGIKILVNAPLSGGYPAVQHQSGDVYVLTTSTLSACPALSSPVNLGGGVWQVSRNTSNGYWCFRSNDATHDISWTNPATTIYKWIPNDDETGFYNVRRFGAVGDGTTDDTQAISRAVLYVASKKGGTLYFPKGIFKVTDTISLPSGIIIQGASGRSTSTFIDAFSPESGTQILLTSSNKSIFRIGENSENIRIKNIELRATSTTGTIGVEAVGKLNTEYGGDTTMISFENMVFWKFDKGLYARASNDDGLWHFDYVKVDSCLFAYNKTAGIHINLFNTDWNIKSTTFLLPQVTQGAADGIHVTRAGVVLLQSVFAGGDDYGTLQGGDFLDIRDIGGLQIISSGAEKTTNSLVWGDDPLAGSLSSTLTIIGSTFGDPILLKKRVTFVSSGNFYGGHTVTATDTNVKIYSSGDRFCYDDAIISLPCGNGGTSGIGFQGVGKVVFQTGQEKNGSIPALPTKIGTDVEIDGDSADVETKPILKIAVPNVPGQGKTFIEMGQSPFFYRISRDRNNGFLAFSGTQGSPYQGYSFDAPLKLKGTSHSGLSTFGGTVGAGALVYCSDCLPNTSPCQSGGGGALAVSTASQWNCK